MFMGYPTNSKNHMKEKCVDGYFLIRSSLSKTVEDVTITSSFTGFLKEYFYKNFFKSIGVSSR